MVEKFGIEITANTTQFQRAMEQVETRTKQTAREFNFAASSAKLFGAAIAGISVAKLATDFVQANRSMQSLEARLTFLTGSVQGAAAAMGYISEVAKRQSVDIFAVGDAYARLQTFVNSGKLSLEEMRTLLEGMNDLSKVHALNTSQLGNVYYGLSQTLSQATIQMSELNQVVEPVPGLLDSISKAAGVTSGEFRQMVADARVTGADFKRYLITALEETAGASERMADTMDSSFNRLKNSYSELLVTLGDTGIIDGLVKGMSYLNEAVRGVSFSVRSLGLFYEGLKIKGQEMFGDAAPEQTISAFDKLDEKILKMKGDFFGTAAAATAAGTAIKKEADQAEQKIGRVTKATKARTVARKEDTQAEREFQRVLEDVADAAKDQAEAQAEVMRGIRRELADQEREVREAMERPYIQAAENIQGIFADAFTNIASGGFKSAAGVGSALQNTVLQALGQSVSAQVFSKDGGASGGFMGGGFNPLSLFSNAIGQTAVGAAINSAGAAAMPSLFGTMIGPTTSGAALSPGLLSGLGMTPATIALAVAAIVLPKILGGMKPRPHPASTFGASIGKDGLGSLNVLSKHIDDQFGTDTGNAVKQIVGGLVGAGFTGLEGTALHGGVDDGRGFFSVGAGIKDNPSFISRFDPNSAEDMDRALAELTVHLARTGKTANEDLAKALQNLQIEGKGASEVLNELAAAAALPELRRQLNEALATEYVQTMDPMLAQLLAETKRHTLLMKQVEELGADKATAEKLHAEKMKQLQEAMNQTATDNTEQLKDQVQQAGQLAQRYGRISETLQKTLDDLKIGQLSPLTPQQRYLEAQRQFNDVARRARVGDADASEALPEAARKFLEVSRDFNAGSGAYTSDFERITAELEAAKNVADRQVSVQTAIEQAAEAQLSELERIRAAIEKPSTQATDVFKYLGQEGGSVERALARTVGFTGQFGNDRFNTFINNPKNAAARSQYLVLARAAGLNVPAFSAGGMQQPNMLSLVGENGPELRQDGVGGRIYSDVETSRMVQGGGGNTGRELAKLAGAVAMLAKAQAETNSKLVSIAAKSSRDSYGRRVA